MGKFGEIVGKANHKVEETLDDLTGTGEEQDDGVQEYYEPRSPEQIQEGGMVVLTKGQVDEQEPGADGRGPDADGRGADGSGDGPHAGS